MSQVHSLENVLAEELKDLYSAENQLVKALPKMIKKASNTNLREGLKQHLGETEVHVERLQKIGDILGMKMTGKVCKAMQGLIEEAKEVIEEESDEPALIDTMLIGAAQRVEHYEMAGYGTARTIARQLGHDQVAELLEETLGEEEVADEKLTTISEEEVLPQASAGAADESEDTVAKRAPQATRARRSKSETRDRA